MARRVSDRRRRICRSRTLPGCTTGQLCTSSRFDRADRHHWFGEGDYERSETVIQQLLAAAGADARRRHARCHRPARPGGRSGLGQPPFRRDVPRLRASHRTSPHPTGWRRGVRAHTSPPTHCRSIIGRSPAIGRPTRRAWSCIIRRVDLVRFHARDVHLVMGPMDGSTPVAFRGVDRHGAAA